MERIGLEASKIEGRKQMQLHAALIAGLTLLFSNNLQANSARAKLPPPEKEQKVYEDQNVGCGPGIYVMKDSTVFSLTMRSTTNHSLSAQAFGISSGTSGCRKHEIVHSTENRAQLFFAQNYWEIEAEQIEQRLDRPYSMAYENLLTGLENR